MNTNSKIVVIFSAYDRLLATITFIFKLSNNDLLEKYMQRDVRY